jgi:hypothetical protein
MLLKSSTNMKLFRARLLTDTPDGTITNNTSKTLVIDFVDAPGEALILAVSAPGGEQHVYHFTGLIGRAPGNTAVAQLTKIIVKPGEKLARSGPGSAEVTGHYE